MALGSMLRIFVWISPVMDDVALRDRVSETLILPLTLPIMSQFEQSRLPMIEP